MKALLGLLGFVLMVAAIAWAAGATRDERHMSRYQRCLRQFTNAGVALDYCSHPDHWTGQ